MKKIFTLATICSAFVLASCAGNSANNAATEVEGEVIETAEIVESTDSTAEAAIDSTAVAADTTATK